MVLPRMRNPRRAGRGSTGRAEGPDRGAAPLRTRCAAAAGIFCTVAGMAAAPARAGRCRRPPTRARAGGRRRSPCWNYSSDDGTGYGLRANLYEYDGRTVPYRRKYSAQLFFTTRGKWVHRLLMDTPRFRGGGDRLEVELVYEKEEFANYYGGLSKAETRGLHRDQKTFSQAFPELKVRWIRPLGSPARFHPVEAAPRQPAELPRDHPERGGRQHPGRRSGPPRGRRRPSRPGQRLAALRHPGQLQRHLRRSARGTPRGVHLRRRRGLPRGPGPPRAPALRLPPPRDRRRPPARPRLDRRGTFRSSRSSSWGAAARSAASPRPATAARRGSSSTGSCAGAGCACRRRRACTSGGCCSPTPARSSAAASWPARGDWRRGAGLGLRLVWQSTIVRADHGFSSGGSGIYITFSQVF